VNRILIEEQNESLFIFVRAGNWVHQICSVSAAD
jgi:hypothetical protein